MEDKKRMNFFLFGSRFLEKLSPCLLKRGHVIEWECTGISPLTCLTELAPGKGDITERYLILDLRSISLPLVKGEGTDDGMFLTLMAESPVEGEKVIDPLRLEDGLVRQLLNLWIDKICRYFIDSHIFLICAYASGYWVADRYLKHCEVDGCEWEELDFIQKWEGYFLQEVGAVQIKTVQYYFLKKEPGRPLSKYFYEPECYMDIVRKLEKSGGVELSKPEYDLSLRRYCIYFDSTIMVKGFELFLDRENFIDSFVLASNKEVVRKWKHDLVRIRPRDWSQPWLTLQRLSKSCLPEELQVLLRAFYGTFQSNGAVGEYNYKLLFQKGIVSNEVMSRMRAYYREVKEGADKRINCYNAGYYWALMNGIDEKEASTYCSKRVKVSPVLVDVFGSCVSRVCFNERFTQNYAMSVLHMWWHVPLYESVQEAVSYPEWVFPDKLNYKDRNVKLQFEHRVFEDIARSQANWLVVDFYSLAAPRTYRYGELVYTDYDGKISERLGASRAKVWGEESVLGDWKAVSQRLQNWCDTVSEKYGTHIILLETSLSDYWIGDDDKIYCFDNIQERFERNLQMKKAFQYIKDRLDCYTVELAGSFLSDELGYSGKADIHYELAFYQVVSGKIQYILENEPAQKCFRSYSGEIRLRRILRLRRGSSASILRKIFPLELDSIVLGLPVDIVKKYFVRVAGWYDRGIESKEALMQKEDFSECPDILNSIKQIRLSESAEEDKLESEYTPYAEDKFLEPYMDKIIKERRPVQYKIVYWGNGADEGNMESSLETRGIRSKLQRNQFSRRGYEFVGWKSYRKSDRRSCCIHGGIRRYFREDEKPAGAEEYLYPDEAAFRALTKVDGDEITMSAVWRKVETLFLSGYEG